jgi:16S rRNA (guanine527-N7)-methyltransferase
MDDNAAKASLNVPRETIERLGAFVGFLAEENRRQNLVSQPSLEQVWSRHIVDSAQLLRFAPAGRGPWLDLGSGAGFPGLIIAALRPGHVTLVESRRLRADFLRRAAEILGVSERVEIACARVETMTPRTFDVITARAFAPLNRLLDLAEKFSTAKTRWILPKGRNAQTELAAAESSWQGEFRLEQSFTDPEAMIIVADCVRRRALGKKAR